MMYLKPVIVFFLCFLYAEKYYAQITGNLIEKDLQSDKIPFTITQFSTKNGLPQNQVLKILPKKDGSLILYTSNGIATFNGYDFKAITNDPDYKKQFFINLFYRADNNILVGLDAKYQLYELWPVFKSLPVSNFTPRFSALSNDSLFLFSDNLEDIHLLNLTSGKSQLLFHHDQFRNTNQKLYLRSAIFYVNKLYLAGDEGLYLFDVHTKKITQLSPNRYTCVKRNPFNGKIYAASGESVYIINQGAIEDSVRLAATSVKIIQDIEFINQNAFFAATHSGLYYINNSVIQHYSKNHGLPSVYLHTLHMDTIHNCLFVGTGEKGLLKLQFKNNYSITSKNGLPQRGLGSVIKTGNNDILTHAGNSIYNIKNDTAVLYTKQSGDFSCIAEINGLVYAGTWGGGILVYKNAKLIDSLTYPENLPNPVIHSCFKDSKGTIWIGTDKGIASGKDNNSIKPVYTNDIKETTICFYELKNSTICVGGAFGAYIIKDNKTVIKLDAKAGFNGKEVRCFYEDAEGKLWIGSYDGGLYCYHQNKLTSVNSMKNCMLYRDVFCMAKDQYGYLYMSSNYGLWKVSEKRLNDFYKGTLSYLIPFHYSEETGIINTEFNGGFQNNYLKAGDHFYFPTLENIVVSVPEKLVERKLTASINTIYVNDTLSNDSNRIFERSTCSVQFDFSCNNFTAKHNVYFQHKLTGEKNYEWSLPQKQTTVYLKMLPPGKYTFWVRAIDAFNAIDPPIAKFTFEVKPHFYETLWFKIITIVLLAIIIIVGAQLRIISQKREIEQKEFYKRKISEVELNAIQAQLNPHFIFNCMNTIKYFILEKDFVHVNDGLNRLSKLIRSSLENSENMFISLEQELTYITNYVELEKMRLQEQLNYTISIDAATQKNMLIPHLLIQPYVENAIKHGIANLEKKAGILSIDFIQTSGHLICTIIDNGIGRTASRKLLSGEELHLSKGTQLAKEKCNLLNQYYNYKCTIEVIDLYLENGDSNGTKIIIKMPAKI